MPGGLFSLLQIHLVITCIPGDRYFKRFRFFVIVSTVNRRSKTLLTTFDDDSN